MIAAIDPGDKHVGFATWSQESGLRAAEIDAVAAPATLELVIDKLELLIIESFVLYPGEAPALSYEPMRTSELIGALRWIAKKAGVEVVMQPASTKEPIRRQCGSRKLDYKHESIHAEDASLHMWYWLIRNGRVTGKPHAGPGRPKREKASVK